MDEDDLADFADAIANGMATVGDIWAFSDLIFLNLNKELCDEDEQPDQSGGRRRRTALLRGYGAVAAMALNAALRTRLVRCGNEVHDGDTVALLDRPWEHFVLGPRTRSLADRMLIVESRRHPKLEMILPDGLEELMETNPRRPFHEYLIGDGTAGLSLG